MENRALSTMMSYTRLLCGLLIFVAAATAGATAPLCERVFLPSSRRVAAPTMTEVVQALKTLLLKPTESRYFYETNWDADQLEVLRNPVYGFNKVIAQSASVPTYLGNKMSLMAGGVGFFHFNMFAEGCFRQQKVVEQNRGLKTSDIAKTETWFEWQPQTRSYQERHGGLAEPLLSPFLQSDGKTVKLYRGLSSDEAKLFRKLQKGDSSVLSELFTARKDALFFTPDPATASMWGSGTYIELTFPLAQLQESYVGLEYSYVEVGIWQPELLDRAARSLKLTRASK